MPLQIQARGFELTRSLERYVRKRIRQGLDARLDSSSRLQVGLSDINGPRGGPDKCCRVHIALPQQRDVVVTETQPDMYAAIDRAISRARQVLARRRSKLLAQMQGRAKRAHRPLVMAAPGDNV